MSQEGQDFVTALGALAEMCGFFSKQLQKNGFTRREALDLVKHLITTQIKGEKQDG